MTNINIRTEDNTKRDAEKLFNELGLNLSVAINAFLKQAIREKGMPFKLTTSTPNETTLNAMKEADELIADKNSKSYTSIKSLKEAIKN